MKKDKKEYFTKPNIYSVFEKSPIDIKKNFFYRVIPYTYIKYSIYMMTLLFFSPILVVLFNSDLRKNDAIFYPILLTLSFSFLLFSLLSGAILFFYKIPYMQELKDKFGYTER